MSINEDELLVRGLGAVGALAGSRQGTEAVARRLRKDVHEIDLAVPLPPAAAAERVRQVIGQQGRVIDVPGGGEPGAVQVVGMVGSGAGNLNPAVLTVTISPAASGSQLLIRGAAKEGLIRQRAGQKAAKRLAAALS